MGAQVTHLIHLQNKVHHPRTVETMYLSEWLRTDYIPSTQFAYCKQGSEETHILATYLTQNYWQELRHRNLKTESWRQNCYIQVTDASSSLLLPILLSMMNYIIYNIIRLHTYRLPIIIMKLSYLFWVLGTCCAWIKYRGEKDYERMQQCKKKLSSLDQLFLMMIKFKLNLYISESIVLHYIYTWISFLHQHLKN